MRKITKCLKLQGNKRIKVKDVRPKKEYLREII